MDPSQPNRRSPGVSRRAFVQQSSLLAAASLPLGKSVRGDTTQSTSLALKSSLPACPHPFLTAPEDYYTVARGNPKPHTLTGQALIDARMTPDTWRLEMTADPFIDPPNIEYAATTEHSLTLKDGTALDLNMLQTLGKKQGIKFIKAMQCLNIAEPLGQGLWEGVPLRDVLQLCGEMTNVRRIYYRGFHNNDPKQIFQSSMSYTQAMETAPGEFPPFLAYKLNGQDISPLRGGPVRLIVPWAHGFKSIKWLQQIFLTNDYRTNDTYALKNNDPESYLKTAAYVDAGENEIPKGKPVTVSGQVISGLSGLDRVEYWLRQVQPDTTAPDETALADADWKPCEIYPEPDWESILPPGVSTRQILGFDDKTGNAKQWPLRYGMGFWVAQLHGLKPGNYEVRVRAVDGNGFAQPDPRPMRKSGKNGIEIRRFKVG